MVSIKLWTAWYNKRRHILRIRNQGTPLSPISLYRDVVATESKETQMSKNEENERNNIENGCRCHRSLKEIEEMGRSKSINNA